MATYNLGMVSLAGTSLSPQERALLGRFADDLRAQDENPLHAVWLFGSRARGEVPSEDSDVDVLVLVDDDSWDAKSRIHDTLQMSARALGLQPLTWSFSSTFTLRNGSSAEERFDRSSSPRWTATRSRRESRSDELIEAARRQLDADLGRIGGSRQ